MILIRNVPLASRCPVPFLAKGTVSMQHSSPIRPTTPERIKCTTAPSQMTKNLLRICYRESSLPSSIGSFDRVKGVDMCAFGLPYHTTKSQS